MSSAKLVIGVVWALCLASFFVATESGAAQLGRLVFWVMGAAHVIECLVFLPRLRSAPGGLAGHVGQTLLFGFVHLQGLRAAPEGAPPSS